nr:hypothetical protein [Tanacetum cinerariifolium]
MIVYSSLAFGERYYLRMLLNVVRGVEGFKELMTTNKRLRATFKERAVYCYRPRKSLIPTDRLFRQGVVTRYCKSKPVGIRPATAGHILNNVAVLRRQQTTQALGRNLGTLSENILEKISLLDFKDLPQPDPSLLTNIDNHLIREQIAIVRHRMFVVVYELPLLKCHLIIPLAIMRSVTTLYPSGSSIGEGIAAEIISSISLGVLHLQCSSNHSGLMVEVCHGNGRAALCLLDSKARKRTNIMVHDWYTLEKKHLGLSRRSQLWNNCRRVDAYLEVEGPVISVELSQDFVSSLAKMGILQQASERWSNSLAVISCVHLAAGAKLGVKHG